MWLEVVDGTLVLNAKYPNSRYGTQVLKITSEGYLKRCEIINVDVFQKNFDKRILEESE